MRAQSWLRACARKGVKPVKPRTAGNGADEEVAGEAEDESDGADAEEDGGGRKASKGFTLIFDIVRRFAQPLGIHLDAWEGRIIETDKGIVRLLPVTERACQLFGDEGAAGLADRIERTPTSARQLELFPAAREPAELQPRGQRRRFVTASAQSAVAQATTLDRVHAAMLLQASGRTNGLRALLAAEQERGPDFLRLDNALTALYPQGNGGSTRPSWGCDRRPRQRVVAFDNTSALTATSATTLISLGFLFKHLVAGFLTCNVAVSVPSTRWNA